MNRVSVLSAAPPSTDLQAVLDALDAPEDVYGQLRALLQAGYGDLPKPGAGQTLSRWHALATIAQHDLSLAKLLESHADALAILHELAPDGQPPAPGLWAVWCAEPPDHRVRITRAAAADGRVRLDGTKAWCSGASHVDHVLISAWDDADRPQLVRVNMAQAAIQPDGAGWRAVGMARTASVDVVFDGALGELVGAPDAYVHRPGFHHGGAGVAACWYGAACALGEQVRRTAQRRPDDGHALAHLGAIDVALVQARALLREAAVQIDAFPAHACETAVRRARLSVEAAAETVLQRAPRAVGAEPMCKDARFARMMADLPVFIRQSHAERDLAAHGFAMSPDHREWPWTL